ncbi:hypothetical protein ICL16_32690 [Iningainema sp. BLCCT55]|uniref:Uncharacterized protein n=2 Tax=Iningainema TaxID=1932705 RepID=A0A8J6Y0A2_9CYAN|nr:hypothetical protein [Iningainema tapete BLCC-T55]
MAAKKFSGGKPSMAVKNNQDSTTENGNTPVQIESQHPLEVHGTLSVAGERPITHSDLQIVETQNIMGLRPIAANSMHIVDTINFSGIRPIASSELVISETYSVMGNRPVASNEIDDADSLMGFLD